MTAPRISVTGNQLPLARVVSRTMHPDEGFHDHAGTVMVIAWGQFIDHDYTLTGTPLGKEFYFIVPVPKNYKLDSNFLNLLYVNGWITMRVSSSMVASAGEPCILIQQIQW